MSQRTKIAIAIFLVALGIRVAFVASAPAVPFGDGHAYVVYAKNIADGKGYVNSDGSPAIRWMPGWSAFVALLYSIGGVVPRNAMYANAVFGATTSVLIAGMGARLFQPRTGVLAGALYAVWPGVVYFCATTHTETFYNLLLAGLLSLLVLAAQEPSRRTRYFAAAGAALGLCALVRGEPLLLAPMVALLMWTTSESIPQFVRRSLLAGGITLALIVPWTIRNYVQLERLIPTCAEGGTVIALGNHAGASGGNDLAFARRYAEQHRGATQAETTLNKNAPGYGDALRFARENPREQLDIVLDKLRLTYLVGDHEGAILMRGYPKKNWQLEASRVEQLARIADVWWFGVLGLSLIGLATLRSWRPEARLVVLGVLGTYLVIHVIFIGGMRFHMPETVVLALAAGRGIEAVIDAFAWLRRRPAAADLA